MGEYNPKNAEGRYATSAGCLRCELCHNVLPDFFSLDEEGRAYVKRQPQVPEEHNQFLGVIHNCPIHGITDKEEKCTFHQTKNTEGLKK